jgi:citrate synthase
MTTEQPTYRTGLGTSDADSITLLGHDLASEFLGKISFGELAYYLIAKQRPSKGQLVMFEAVLAALADHGFTPTAIAARLTYASAPDSLQGALAAGLLGGGSRFLGVTEDCALFLNRELTRVGFNDRTPAEWDDVAREVVRLQKEAGKFVPGLGHPVHKQGDPRTPVLMALARENGTFGPHLALFEAVLADLGLPLGVMRGVALLARCAGLLGHIVEEQTHPIGVDIYMNVDRNIDYQPPV